MPSINVRYFAMLKEKAGVASEDLSFEGSYGELYQSLSEKYGFTLSSEMVQVAVNDEFSHAHRLVEEGARVVFIPPVAGG